MSRKPQYTKLVDAAIYDEHLVIDAYNEEERIELINALLDQWGWCADSCHRVIQMMKLTAPETISAPQVRNIREIKIR